MVIAAVAIGYKNLFKLKSESELKFECVSCKYIYNPKVGNEAAGVKPHTEFDDLPDDWKCPVCGKEKDNFKLREEK